MSRSTRPRSASNPGLPRGEPGPTSRPTRGRDEMSLVRGWVSWRAQVSAEGGTPRRAREQALEGEASPAHSQRCALSGTAAGIGLSPRQGTKKAPDCGCNQGLKVPATCYSPTGEPRSTLADEALHFRVRNGNGCCILSMATGKTIERIWLDAP